MLDENSVNIPIKNFYKPNSALSKIQPHKISAKRSYNIKVYSDCVSN